MLPVLAAAIIYLRKIVKNQDDWYGAIAENNREWVIKCEIFIMEGCGTLLGMKCKEDKPIHDLSGYF